MPQRATSTSFKPGDPKPPGSGMKKGQVCGRKRALGVLDKVATKHLDLLEKAFSKELIKDPALFWRRYIYPSLPKEMQIEFEGKLTGLEYMAGLLDELVTLREKADAGSQSDS